MEIMREINDNTELNNPAKIDEYLSEFKDQDREHFVVLGLDTKNKPIYREIAAIGTLDANLISPREVFKKAIMMSCKSIVVAHNHPSGDTEPSKEDIEVTEELRKAGDILEIPVLDHIVIGSSDKEGHSMRMREDLDF